MAPRHIRVNISCYAASRGMAELTSWGQGLTSTTCPSWVTSHDSVMQGGPVFPLCTQNLAHGGHFNVFWMNDSQVPGIEGPTLSPCPALWPHIPRGTHCRPDSCRWLPKASSCATSKPLPLMFGDTQHTADVIRKANSVLSGSKANRAQSRLRGEDL